MAIPAASAKNPFLDPQLTGAGGRHEGAGTGPSPLGAEAFASGSGRNASNSAAERREGASSPSPKVTPSTGGDAPGASPAQERDPSTSASPIVSTTRTTSSPVYAPPALPPPDHSPPSPSSSSNVASPSTRTTFAPPPGPPPSSSRPSTSTASARSNTAEAGYSPTTQPSPGRPLLKDGRLLVYPRGFNCGKCMNTGYKSFDPSHPCKKCWSSHSVPYSKAILASFGISSSGEASSPGTSGSTLAQTSGKTLQRPLPATSGMHQGRWGAGPDGGPWSPPPLSPHHQQQQPYYHPQPPLQPQQTGWQPYPAPMQPMPTGASSWGAPGPYAPPPHAPSGVVRTAVSSRAPVHRTEEARESERAAPTTTGEGVDEDGVPTGEAPPAYDEVVGNARPAAHPGPRPGPGGGVYAPPPPAPGGGGGAGVGSASQTYAPPQGPPHSGAPAPSSGWSGGAPYGGAGYHSHAPHSGWGPPGGAWPHPAPPHVQPHGPYPTAAGPYGGAPHPHQVGSRGPPPLVLRPGDPRMGGQLCPRCGGLGTRTTFFGIVEETCDTCGGAGRVFT